jgi:plasmid stabilization system protein ParE
MKDLRFHPEAEDDVTEALQWYEQRSAIARRAFANEIDRAFQHITDAPLRYPQGRRGEHRFVLDRFPYTILYRVREDHLFVTAVAHQSRRPGYWRHRK